MPKSNVEFWTAKFARNVARDKKEHAELEKAGWKVIVIWECEAKQRLPHLEGEITTGNPPEDRDGDSRKESTP